jgi:hypothetical protein
MSCLLTRLELQVLQCIDTCWTVDDTGEECLTSPGTRERDALLTS